jgi:MinD superfamily P-loop ATPase
MNPTGHAMSTTKADMLTDSGVDVDVNMRDSDVNVLDSELFLSIEEEEEEERIEWPW